MAFIWRLLVFFCVFLSWSSFAKVDLTINGVKGDLKDNVKSYILSISEPQGRNLGTYRDSVLEETGKSLMALGYYQPKIELQVSLKDQTPGKLVVVVDIDAGEPVIITKIDKQVLGEARHDEEFLTFLKNLPLEQDKPLNHGLYASVKSSITSKALQRGYFNGKFKKASVEVESKTNQATIYLWFDSGTRYRYGKVLFTQPTPAESLIRNMVTFEQGDFYLNKDIAEFSVELSDTGYFRNVLVRPNLDKAVGNQVPIEITVGLKPTNSFEVGAGVTTDIGPRMSFNWTRPWVNDYGHSLGTNFELSKPSQTIAAYYKVPVKDPNTDYWNFQLGYQRLDENDTESNKYTVSANRFSKTSGNWDRNAYVKYEIEDSTQGSQDLRTQLLLPGVTYTRTRVRGGLNAHWGDKQILGTEVASKYWGSDQDILKFYGQTKWLRSVTPKHRFLTRLELGAIAVDSIENVPATMRFFAGGDQSIRGFGYKSIAPRDDENKLVGGKYLAVASVEYSYPVKENWRIATFVDGGTATNDFSEEILYGTGVGAAWASPIGPIKIFVGTPINGDEDGIRIHFLMGPEL